MTEQGLFNTVPKEYTLEMLYDELGNPDAKNVMEFLDLSRADLSALFKVKVDSIRFDNRMPTEMKEWLIETANICEFVARHFEKDVLKSKTWFKIRNPLLDNQRPIDLIKSGNSQKLEALLVQSANSI